MESLSKELISFRKEWDMTQTELAELSGISQPIISKIEGDIYKYMTEEEYSTLKYVMSDKCMFENVLRMKANKKIAQSIKRKMTRHKKSAVLDKLGIQGLKNIMHGRIDFLVESFTVDILIRYSLVTKGEIERVYNNMIKSTRSQYGDLSEAEMNIISTISKVMSEPFSGKFEPIREALYNIFKNKEHVEYLDGIDEELLEEWQRNFLN